MATKNVMIDIETMSTKTDALVLSIGMREFVCAPDGPKFEASMMITPSFMEQVLLGRRVDRDTQLWWKNQPAAASMHWRLPDRTLNVSTSLMEVRQFCRDADEIWARGPQFDITILNSLAADIGNIEICDYSKVLDQRTYTKVTLFDRPSPKPTPTEALLDHHPLADCDKQIKALWEHGYRHNYFPAEPAAT